MRSFFLIIVFSAGVAKTRSRIFAEAREWSSGMPSRAERWPEQGDGGGGGRFPSNPTTKLTYLFQGRDFRLTDVEGELVRPLLA